MEQSRTLIGKIFFILTGKEKRIALRIVFVLIIGMILETLGTGLIVPLLSYLTDSVEFVKKYPKFINLLKLYGLSSHQQIVVVLLIILALVNVLKVAILAFLSFTQSRFTFNLQSSLSKKLFQKYMDQHYAFHLDRNSSRLLQNITAEVNGITTMISQLMFLLTDLALLISILFLLLYVEPIGAIFSFLVFGGFGWVFYMITKNYVKRWGQARQYHETLGIQHLQQGLGGIKDIKILGREDFFINKFGIHRDGTAHVSQRQMFLSQLPKLWLELLAIVTLAILVVIQIAEDRGMNSMIPTLGLFVTAAFRIMPSINRIINGFQAFNFSIPSINIVYSELQLEQNHNKSNETLDTLTIKKQIEFKNISFHYTSETRLILNNLNLNFPVGKMIGIIGESGEGKSTFIDIILGLLKPNIGHVSTDNVDIHSNLRSWQSKVGYVPQTIFLTDDSLRRNIAFGLSEERINSASVMKAVRSAKLESLIANSPEGLDTIVGERGVRLSGGQRQRIGIARALYNNPDILVFDEATSSLDEKTEGQIMETIAELQGRKTIIIATHRLSTVEDVDQLYLIKRGRLILQRSK